jgi:hypothetical protein
MRVTSNFKLRKKEKKRKKKERKKKLQLMEGKPAH